MHLHNSVSFSTTRAPPPQTIFPYTTLFRSPPRQASPGLREQSERGARQASRAVRAAPRGSARTARDACRAPRSEDRKSTRLNASHLGISYAVFCLKKKIIE